MKNNAGRLTFEERMKFDIKKVKRPDVKEVLLSNKESVLYNYVLINNHSVVMLDKWIFDPTLKNAIPRNEKHLRFCA